MPDSRRAPLRADPSGRGRACAASGAVREAGAGRSAPRARRPRRGDAPVRGRPRSAIRVPQGGAPRGARSHAWRRAPRTRRVQARARARARDPTAPSRSADRSVRAPAGRRRRSARSDPGRAPRHRPRAGSREGLSAAAVPEAPSAAARRESAPSSGPSPAPPRPRGRRRSARGTRCGSRAGAGSRGAPAVCPLRSAPARVQRMPPAGRGAENPSRDTLNASIVAPGRYVRPGDSAGRSRVTASARPAVVPRKVGRWTSVAAAPRKKRPMVAPRAP